MSYNDIPIGVTEYQDILSAAMAHCRLQPSHTQVIDTFLMSIDIELVAAFRKQLEKEIRHRAPAFTVLHHQIEG